MSVLSSFSILSVLLVINQQSLVKCTDNTKKYTYSVNTRQFVGTHDLITFPDEVPVNDESMKTTTAGLHHDTMENQMDEVITQLTRKLNDINILLVYIVILL